MTTRRLVAWFAVVLVLSLSSRATLPRLREGRCRLDGNRLVPVYRVDLMHDGRVLESFCCVRCAREWPDVPPGAYWRVRDEVTGEPLDAERASFVESTVVTIPSRQDRVHVFRRWPDAMSHANAYDGRPVPNPFAERPTTGPAPIPSGGDEPPGRERP